MNNEDWSLVGRGGYMNDYIFPLHVKNICIGTDPNACSMIYPQDIKGIAKIHCQLIFQNDDWLLTDFSESGTWLNGKKLTRGEAVSINSGDVFYLASPENSFILKYKSLNPNSEHNVKKTETPDDLKKIYNSTLTDVPQNGKSQTLRKKFFSTKGRLNRKSYIIRTLILASMQIINSYILMEIDKIPAKNLNNLGIAVVIALLIFIIVLSVSAITLMVRRLHDTDNTGWWSILGLIPIANFILSLYLWIKKGTDGPNRFGDDPLRNY